MSLHAFPTRSTSLTALAVLLLISGSLVGCSSDEEDAASGQATPATAANAGEQPTATIAQAGEQPTATTETVYISAEFEEWVLSTEGVVKHADDVYIGTVLSAGETFSRYGDEGDVWTPFTVEVEQRLLGSVEGTITVVQQGGFDPDQKLLVIIEGDPLLEVGETYMFASRTGRTPNRPEWEGQHVAQPVKGRVRINDEAHRQELVQEYSDAITRAGLGS